MKYMSLSLEMLAELNNLVEQDITDITNPHVVAAAFYLQVQSATILNTRVGFGVIPAKTMLLLATIAATSPTLKSVFLDIDLSVCGPTVTTALVSSDSITGIHMGGNNLGATAIAVANILAAPGNIIESVSIKGNNLGATAVAVANILAAPGSAIISVDISDNNIGADAIAVANILAAPGNIIERVSVSDNNIGVDAIAVANILAAPGSAIISVDMSNNNIGADGGAVANILAATGSEIQEIVLWEDNDTIQNKQDKIKVFKERNAKEKLFETAVISELLSPATATIVGDYLGEFMASFFSQYNPRARAYRRYSTFNR